MTMTSLRCAAAAVLVGCLMACPGPADTPANVVERFYTARIESASGGVPTTEDLAILAPYLSTELHGLLEQARRRHDEEAARTPDEKPSFADGDLFSSLFEGPTLFDIGPGEVTGDVHRISVQLAYDRQQPVISWTDRAVVKMENGKPVIADIEFGGNWEFGNKGTLVSMLKRALTPEVAASVLGKWQVAGHRTPGATAMNPAQAQALHGQAIEYTPETATSGKDVCPQASYTTRRDAAGSYLAAAFKIDPQKLGLKPDTVLDITEVSCGGVSWGTLGGLLIVTPAGRAFAPRDGMFFELQRR